jgi:hypothetical protein
VKTESIGEIDLKECFVLATETVVRMLVGGFAALGGLEIKGPQEPGIDLNSEMSMYSAMARVSAGNPGMQVCTHCLQMFIAAHRNPEFEPEFWDDDIGEAVACVLSAWPDASDEEVIRLYQECEQETNSILANPHVGQVIGRFLARIAMMGELSEESALQECLRTLVLENGELNPETIGGVSVSLH